MPKPARSLVFESLDNVVAEVDRLRAAPYRQAGQWDLAKVVAHLAKSIGSPFSAEKSSLPAPLRPIARFIIRRIARLRQYPSIKFPMPKMLRPAAGVSLDDAYNQLTDAVSKVGSVPGPEIDLPPLGRIGLADFRRLQLLHAAHHLGFLVPA
jgi:hypothetical protein